MLKSLLLLPLLSVPVFAQQDSAGTVPAMTFRAPTVVYRAPARVSLAGCPVGIAAEPPHGTPQSVWVASVEGVAQGWGSEAKTGVHVSLSSMLAGMSEVTVSVRYRRYGRGAVLVSTSPRGSEEKTFALKASGGKLLERNLLVGGYVEIERVRVLKVTYANGTKWETAAEVYCSARPGRLLLVEGW